MKKRYLLLAVLVPLAALGFWVYAKKTEPPAVPFSKVKRETLVSSLVTNGKAEPLEYAAVHSEMRGLVVKLPVKQGETVAKGAVLAELSVPDLASELSAAQSRVEQAKADLANIERGGRKVELADLDARLARAKLDREADQREYNALRRLEAKQAATPHEVTSALGKVKQTDLDIEALTQKRAALVTASDRLVAEAGLHQAESEVALARRRIADSTVRSPIAGTVYALPVRQGSYLNPGDLVANIGRLDRMRVRVYVDEPELGRVAIGMPVTITWEAQRGRQWHGEVEQLPSEIQALGTTRQVGEVRCTIENPGRELAPGANVDVEIRSRVVPGALTIPTEALRRDSSGPGVFVLSGDTLAWRSVRTGAASISRIQIEQGLAESESVALPTDVSLRNGMRVTPLYP